MNSYFDGDISTWDVSRVTDMYEMSFGCSSLDEDLDMWDTGSVRSMSPKQRIQERIK